MLENTTGLIDRLRSLPNKTEYVEFKRSFSDFEREGQDICALANSAAYHNVKASYKIWGIDDKTHEVLGNHAPVRLLRGGR